MFFVQILLNSLVLGTQVLMVAVPLYLVYSVSRIFHLGLGAIAAGTAYSFYWLISLKAGVLPAVLFSLLAIVFFTAASYWLLSRYIERKQPLFALLVSFSAGVALESLLAIIFGSDGKSIMQGVLPTLHVVGLNLTIPGLITILVGIFGLMGMALILHKTPFGRALRSLAEDPSGARSLGLDAGKIRWITLFVAVLMAGFVGIMAGLNTALTPGMGFNFIILAFVAFLIGGTTHIAGTFIASYLVAFVPQLIISYSTFSASWQLFFVFILAACMLLVWPKGLFYSSARNT